MTIQEKKQFCREKIIAAVGEIMDLKFGCEVEGTLWMMEYLDDPYIIIGGTWICKKHKKYREECTAEEDGCSGEDGFVVRYGNEENGWGNIKLKESELGKILGRPITLQDFLRAVPTRLDVEIELTSDGKIKIGYDNHADENSHTEWIIYDLSLDFDHQSDAFYEWAWEILK